MEFPSRTISFIAFPHFPPYGHGRFSQFILYHSRRRNTTVRSASPFPQFFINFLENLIPFFIEKWYPVSMMEEVVSMEKKSRLLWLIPLLAAAGVAFYFLRTQVFADGYSAESVRDWVDQFSPWGEAAFFLLQLFSVVIAPIPSNITAAAGGLLFGTVASFLLTAVAVALGSCIVFALARFFGRSFAQKFVSEKLSARYLDLIERKRDTFLVLTFLFPFFPDDLLCILAGLTDIPFRRFALIALFTRPWGLLAACALGGSAFSIPPLAIPPLALALALLFYFGLKYGDRIEDAIVRRFRR